MNKAPITFVTLKGSERTVLLYFSGLFFPNGWNSADHCFTSEPLYSTAFSLILCKVRIWLTKGHTANGLSAALAIACAVEVVFDLNGFCLIVEKDAAILRKKGLLEAYFPSTHNNLFTVTLLAATAAPHTAQ